MVKHAVETNFAEKNLKGKENFNAVLIRLVRQIKITL